jgi:cytochrome c-type biogenesis protein CcmH
MPLAILRLKGKDLPARFALDDSMGMAGGAKLSQTPAVRIEARVSKTGTALAQAGDFAGSSPPVKPGARDVVVVIDKVTP